MGLIRFWVSTEVRGDYMLSFDAGPGGHGDFSLAVPSAAEGLYVLRLYYVSRG